MDSSAPSTASAQPEVRSIYRPSEGQDLKDFDFGKKRYAQIKPTVFIDLGARTGNISRHVANAHPNWTIIAVEPISYNALCHYFFQCANNPNIVPVPFAVWRNGDPNTSMFHPRDQEQMATITTDDGDCSHMVCSMTLDQLFRQFVTANSRVLLNCDINGAEHFIFQHFSHWHQLAHVHVEMNSSDYLRRRGHSASALAHLIQNHLPNGSTYKFTVRKDSK